MKAKTGALAAAYQPMAWLAPAAYLKTQLAKANNGENQRQWRQRRFWLSHTSSISAKAAAKWRQQRSWHRLRIAHCLPAWNHCAHCALRTAYAAAATARTAALPPRAAHCTRAALRAEYSANGAKHLTRLASSLKHHP